VPRDADAKAIRDAFRTLALRYHPDRNKEPGAEERFKEIAEAYAVLSDPDKRTAYDRGGFAAASVSPEDLFAGINFDELFRGAGFGFGDDLFDRIFHRHRTGPARGEDLETAIGVSLEKIAQGGEETVRATRLTVCGACHGSGAAAGTAPKNCEACHGSGQHVSRRQDGGMVVQYVTACPACHGAGTIIEKPCGECSGTGKVERVETLEVKIPPGAEEGTVLRIAGRGLPSRDPSGTPGDLLITLYTAPDPRFERHGPDLWHRARIQVPDAVLGTTLDVPTLDGYASVKVPQGTQPDSVLRLRSKGLPKFGGRGHGSLFVRIEVQVPEQLSAEERKLYEHLQTLARK
jgi:molecular chaperone DnaJ